MSEMTETQQGHEARDVREPAAGPLLPRWFKVAFYGTLGPFSLFALVYIAQSLYVQQVMTSAVAVLKGDVAGQLSDLSAPQAQAAVDVLKRHPVRAFLYCNQELLQSEEGDPRMARALALRKAIAWGTTSTRRDTIRSVLAGMTDAGFVEADVLDDQVKGILEGMIEERRASPEMTYAEQRITDVLVWLADGAVTRPTGVEKRRLGSLLAQYEKKAFVGEEAEALIALGAEWSGSSDAAAAQAAERFPEMLAGERSELPPEAAEFCAQRADHWEDMYHQGMLFLAEAGKAALQEALAGGRRVDHPHVYQYISLLGSRFDDLRSSASEGVWLLRHNYFCVRFLSYFASKTAINPVMAVETIRLTREEHEREMRHANARRMRECVQLLGRVGVDYVRNRDDYPLPQADDADEYVRKYVVHALEVLTDDERVGDLAQQALAAITEADSASPAGHSLTAQ